MGEVIARTLPSLTFLPSARSFWNAAGESITRLGSNRQIDLDCSDDYPSSRFLQAVFRFHPLQHFQNERALRVRSLLGKEITIVIRLLLLHPKPHLLAAWQDLIVLGSRLFETDRCAGYHDINTISTRECGGRSTSRTVVRSQGSRAPARF